MRKVLLLIDYQKGFKSDCSKATIPAIERLAKRGAGMLSYKLCGSTPKNLTVRTYRILAIQRTVRTTEGMLW